MNLNRKLPRMLMCILICILCPPLSSTEMKVSELHYLYCKFSYLNTQKLTFNAIFDCKIGISYFIIN